MKRKSILILAAILTLSTGALVGCSDGAPSDVSSTVASLSDSVVGTWTLSEETVGQEPIDLTDTESVYVFRSDNTFTMLLNGDDLGSGTYTTDGDTVTIDLDGAQTDLTLSGDTLRMDTDTPDGRAVMIYQRAKQ